MSSKTIPTPYMWSFQPQSGRAAGASQDYSTRINWMGAGPAMINRVYGIRDQQNGILVTQAAITETPRGVMNPPAWPARLLPQVSTAPTTLALPRNELIETALSNSGAQLAGGGGLRLPPPTLPPIIGPELMTGGAVQLNERVERYSHYSPRADGLYQLGGGSRSSFNPLQAFLTIQQGSSVPRSGGIGAEQFVREFVPAVYLNPFSGPPDSFPNQFMPNYNIVTDSVAGYE